MEQNLLNFKSVMLSDRPPVSTGMGGGAIVGQHKHHGPAPFNSMVRMRDTVGLVPAKDKTVRHAAELNPEGVVLRRETDVVARHKRWLREQQRALQEARDLEIRELLEMEEKQRAFKDNQRQKRELLKLNKEAILASQVETQEEMERYSEHSHVQSHHSQQHSHHHHHHHHGRGKAKDRRRGAMPKWALTSEAAEGVEEDEVEELLDFAENLDFGSYLEDYEVKQAMSLVKARVKQLEARQKEIETVIEEYYEEVPEGEEEEAGVEYRTERKEDGSTVRLKKMTRRVARPNATRRHADENEEEMRAREEGWVDPVAGNATYNKDRARLQAERILQNSQGGLRTVHSAASLGAVIARNSAPINPNAPQPPPLPPPRRVNVEIVKSGADRVAARRQVDPSNLPYLYRSPAI